MLTKRLFRVRSVWPLLITEPETPLAGSVTARWRSLADTSVVVPTVPLLTVADYVPWAP
jgi:hypothetical protein